MVKNLISIVLIIVFIFSLNTCNSTQNKVDKVVIGYLPIIAHLPAIIAREKKLFKNSNVVFRVFGSSNDLISSLENNEINIATTIAVAPLIQHNKTILKNSGKVNIKMFQTSRTTKLNPFDSVFTNNKNIKTIADIHGKRVGVFPGSTAKNIFSFFIKSKFNIDPNSIKWKYLPPGRQINALMDKEIDVLFTYETMRTVVEENSFNKIYDSVIASVLENAPYGCSAINLEFFNTNKELAKKIINAFDEGVIFIRNNERESRLILKESLGISNKISEKCNLEYRNISTKIGSSENISLLEKFINIMIKANEIDSDIEIKNLLLL